MSNISLKKKELRSMQLKKRKQIFIDSNKSFNLELFEKFFRIIKFDKINIISSFVSIKSEILTDKLNEYIISKNKILCLPAIFKKNEHLIFREYQKNEKLIKGEMNTFEPNLQNRIIIPELLFVPCLAFDDQGYRLGYGGGYYDRTFTYLTNNNKKYISVGYAFNEQKVLDVPHDKFDIKLNYVITEKKIYSF